MVWSVVMKNNKNQNGRNGQKLIIVDNTSSSNKNIQVNKPKNNFYSADIIESSLL